MKSFLGCLCLICGLGSGFIDYDLAPTDALSAMINSLDYTTVDDYVIHLSNGSYTVCTLPISSNPGLSTSLTIVGATMTNVTVCSGYTDSIVACVGACDFTLANVTVSNTLGILTSAPSLSSFNFDTVSFEDMGSSLISFFVTFGNASFNNCQFLRSDVSIIINVAPGANVVITGCDVVECASRFVSSSSASVVVDECSISGLVPKFVSESSIYATGTTVLTITNSEFFNLTGRSAVDMQCAAVLIDSCSFTNSSFEWAIVLGACFSVCDFTVTESVFENNHVGLRGGIGVEMAYPGSTATISFCTFFGNSANIEGAALWLEVSDAANAFVEDVLAGNNYAGGQGGCARVQVAASSAASFTRVTTARKA